MVFERPLKIIFVFYRVFDELFKSLKKCYLSFKMNSQLDQLLDQYNVFLFHKKYVCMYNVTQTCRM